MTRRFLVVAHRVPVDGNFTLNDLAGSGGRFDELARIISSVFIVSNGIRRDSEVTFHLVSDPRHPRRVRLVGSRLKYLNPDERSTAALVKNGLGRGWDRPDVEMETTPGIFVGPLPDPEGALREFAGRPGAVWLHESGAPLRGAELPEDPEFLLSDPYDLVPSEEGCLRDAGVRRISVGPRSLPSSQCVTLVHNELDLRGP